MSRATRDKAAKALLEGRITVVKCTPVGLAIECKSSRVLGVRYLAAVYRDEVGLRRSCTCPNGRVHPIHPKCWHVLACELLRDNEGSSR